MLENFFAGIGLGIFATLMFNVVAFGRKANAIVCVVSLAIMSGAVVLKLLPFADLSKLTSIYARPLSGFSLELSSLILCILFAVLFIVRFGMFGNRIIYGVALIVSLYALWAQGAMMLMPSRPAWNVAFVPLIYIVSAVAAGGSFTAIFSRGSGKDGNLSNIPASASLLMIFLMAGYCVYLATAPFPHSSRSLERALAGDLAPFFWGAAALYAFSGLILYMLRNTGYVRIALVATFITCSIATFMIKNVIISMGTSAQQFIF